MNDGPRGSALIVRVSGYGLPSAEADSNNEYLLVKIMIIMKTEMKQR